MFEVKGGLGTKTKGSSSDDTTEDFSVESSPQANFPMSSPARKVKTRAVTRHISQPLLGIIPQAPACLLRELSMLEDEGASLSVSWVYDDAFLRSFRLLVSCDLSMASPDIVINTEPLC